jgi:hypothetical protein
MAAPTSFAERSIALANGEPSTHGAKRDPFLGHPRDFPTAPRE